MPTAITHDPVFTTTVSSTNTAVVRWSGTAGAVLQDSGVLIDGSNNITGAGTIGSGAITSTGGITGTQVDILAQGDLRLQDTTGGQYVALQAAGTTTSHTLTLPATQGGSSTVLTNDGAGALTWAAAGPTEATPANMEAEATGSLFVPPDLVKNSPGVAKFWVYWEQSGTHSMLASYNMTSVTDGGSAGITNHVFATDFSSANWCGVSMPGSVNGGTIRQNGGGNRAAGTMSTTSEDSGGTDTDMSHCGMAGFGDQ